MKTMMRGGGDRRLFYVFLSVVFFRLSFPGGPMPFLAGVCFVPLGLAIHSASNQKTILYCFLFSFAGWLSSVWWLTHGLISWVNQSQFTAWLWVLCFCFYFALPYVFFGLFYSFCQSMQRPMGAFKSAACMTIMVSWYPNILPGNPAHSLYTYPIVTQILDLGGVPLLLFALCYVNWLLVEIIIKVKEHKNPFPAVVSFCLLLAVIFAYGTLRLNQFEDQLSHAGTDQVMTIISIQPNIPVANRRDVPEEDRANNMDTVLNMTRQALRIYPDAELAVWPELPIGSFCDDQSDLRLRLLKLIREYNVPFIIPCIQKIGSEKNYRYSMLYIDENGEYNKVYNKQVLVPFGEYLPFEDELPILRKLFPGVLNYQSGKDVTLFETKKKCSVIPALCYEAVFSNHIRKFVERGGNMIVNIIDDAWFGKSSESAIHLSLGIYRAIEYRTPIIRVTNSGNGVFVHGNGKIVEGSRTPEFRKKITAFKMFVPEQRSPFTVLGNTFLYFITFGFISDMIISLLLCKEPLKTLVIY